MNQEINAGTQDTQQEKATQIKRSKSTSKNRPVLVTASNDVAIEDQSDEVTSDSAQLVEEVTPPTSVEETRTRRFPKFFSNVGKKENDGTIEADQASARIARATRNSGIAAASSRATKDSSIPKQPQSNTDKVSTNKPTPKAVPAKAAPSRGGFKTKYLYGMIIYVIVAMFVGQYERAFLLSNHLDKTLFQIGSFAVTTSTALYLLTLIILLVVLARFDLIPRSLGAMSGQSTSQSSRSNQSSSVSENSKGSQPTMKQGVKGADDDLYQEYREQQRYLQKRERKK